MRKTSIYLDDADVELVRRLAEQQGKSQAEIIRAAIEAYAQEHVPVRNFSLLGSFEGDGTSIADISEEELLRGFGSDTHR